MRWGRLGLHNWKNRKILALKTHHSECELIRPSFGFRTAKVGERLSTFFSVINSDLGMKIEKVFLEYSLELCGGWGYWVYQFNRTFDQFRHSTRKSAKKFDAKFPMNQFRKQIVLGLSRKKFTAHSSTSRYRLRTSNQLSELIKLFKVQDMSKTKVCIVGSGNW